ncbi:hypothetical protein ACOX9X_05480 [Photobacterium leiognathi subsp. mandapamensis]|uniref:hypothetical protein n=1 Tax=Photobacterium leiognathi TaxID=553611 RepID=UPI003BF5BC31
MSDAFTFNTDPLANLEFTPVQINGRKRDVEQIAVTHRLKRDSSSEIIIRIGRKTLKECSLEYGDTVYVGYSTYAFDHVLRISSQASHGLHSATLSKQNSSSENSAAVIRFVHKNKGGFPDLLQEISKKEGKSYTRVKFVNKPSPITKNIRDLIFVLEFHSAE